MQVFHTAGAPPNQGRICLAIRGWTRNSRNAERKIEKSMVDGPDGDANGAVIKELIAHGKLLAKGSELTADMIEKLQILNNYTPKPGATPATDADYLHYLIESWRVKDGGARIADPDRWPIDLGDHLQPGHALGRYGLLAKDKVWVAPGGGGRGGVRRDRPGDRRWPGRNRVPGNRPPRPRRRISRCWRGSGRRRSRRAGWR